MTVSQDLNHCVTLPTNKLCDKIKFSSVPLDIAKRQLCSNFFMSSSCLCLVSHAVLHSVAKHTNRQQQQNIYHPVHSALTFEATRGSPLS